MVVSRSGCDAGARSGPASPRALLRETVGPFTGSGLRAHQHPRGDRRWPTVLDNELGHPQTSAWGQGSVSVDDEGLQFVSGF